MSPMFTVESPLIFPSLFKVETRVEGSVSTDEGMYKMGNDERHKGKGEESTARSRGSFLYKPKVVSSPRKEVTDKR